MNAANIWQEFLKIVTEEVGSRVVETWFKSVSLSQWDSATKTVYLKAPNAFIKDWIFSHYKTLLKTHLGRLLNEKDLSILFLDESKSEVSCSVEPPIKQHAQRASSSPHVPAKHSMQSRYQFDSFVVGPNNALAFKAAQAVAEKPGGLYNPLFIHGASGLGKTHLLHAVGNHIKRTSPKARIVYQSADRFVHEFITAIRFDKAASFEQRYKEADVLLIDDIQLISNKEHTQEAFYHIFNALHDEGKQIVFSSDSLPREITGLSERLRTRFNGGLITDLQPPTLETKIAILQKKADFQKEELTEDVAHFIASRVSSNIRELEGVLIRVLAFATLTHQALSLELAHKVLQKTTPEIGQRARLDLPRIADKIAKYYNYSIVEMRSSKRHENLALARHVAMYFMKKNTRHSLADIAAFWCRKDHSTVIHALDKIRGMSDKNEEFRSELDRINSLFFC
ncbi:chromosomal replication initiator protein DnaA [Candidatus Dependentiae bacterium]|nr:chromosomal replication initiator protein DnaA [Candidatus Dependentiae bacterium]